MTTPRCTLFAYRMFITVLLLLSTYVQTSAQVGTLTLVNPPQSPQAAALGKFVEVPVGYYSGLPNINVPLYTVQVKNVTIPIGLSYHALGIKVSELPGQVGTGWTLNAGGVITRVVKGYPDDHVLVTGGSDYYDTYNAQVKQDVRTASGSSMEAAFSSDECYNILFSTPGIDAEAEQNSSLGILPMRMDTEIDLFYFNFLGKTGQFTFTNEGIPMLLSGGNDMKIEYNERLFKLTDAEGIEYYFEDQEDALDMGGTNAGGTRHYTASWYLSRIYLPAHDQEITFTYRNYVPVHLYYPNIVYDYNSAFYNRTDRLMYENHTWQNYLGTVPGQDGCPPYDQNYSLNFSQFPVKTLFISEIKWNNNSVYFYGDTTRLDLYKYKLDSIKVKAGNQVMTTIRLNYDYFNANSSTRGKRRLKLNEVKINDQQYTFGYIDSLHGRSMPVISSHAKDLWGYYNGEDDNGNTIPYFKFFDDWLDPNIFHYITDAHSTPRNPDYKYAQLGMLSSITYPTGGKTTFEYEGNDYTRVGFLDETKTVETDPYTQIALSTYAGKPVQAFTNPAYTWDEASGERDFTIHKDQVCNFTLNMGLAAFQIPYSTYVDSVYNWWTTAQGSVYVKKYNDSTRQFDTIRSFSISPIDSIGLPANEWDYNLIRHKGIKVKNDTITLKEGRYLVTADISGWYMNVNMNIITHFPYKKTDTIYNSGGLRIKKIAFASNTDTDTSYVKTYAYKIDSLSTGVLESPFANVLTGQYFGGFHPFYLGGELVGLHENCLFFNLSIESNIPLGNNQGGIIGYSSVKEYREDSSYRVFHFTNGTDSQTEVADVFLESTEVPTRTNVLIDNSWKRGLLTQVNYYNNSKVLIKQDYTKYKYETNQLYQQSVSMYVTDIWLYPAVYTNFAGYQKTTHFPIRYNRHALKEEDSTVLYTASGNSSEVTRYEYRTNAWPHVYPVSITRRNSAGDYTITNLKYPQDYTHLGANPVHNTAKSIRNLLSKNVLSVPIETYVQRKDANGANLRTVSGQYVRYKQTQAVPDTAFTLNTTAAITSYQPVVIDSVKSVRNSAYKPAIHFIRYDSSGNVVEQSKKKDIKEVVVWGYKRQYPVARVIGSSYDAVMARVNAAIINNPVNDQQLETELRKIRTGLADSNALVTTYTWAPLKGITTETDPTGKKIFYSYDEYGRLALVRDQDNKILKKICYNYQGQAENCSWYGNLQKSKVFTRNNCTNDSTGRDTTYIVPAATYYATTQAAADSLATADITVNGQAFANTKGRCVLLKYYSQRVYGDFYSELCDWPDAQPYYIDIPDSTFISFISQQDANNHAWWAAQDSANLHGQCIHFVDVQFRSYTTAAYNFDVILSKADEPWEQYFFSCFYGSGSLGSVPEGTYHVEFVGVDPWGGHDFYAGCWSSQYAPANTYNIYLYNVDIDDTCNELKISPYW